MAEFWISQISNIFGTIVGYIAIYRIMFTMLRRRKHIWILIAFSSAKSFYSNFLTMYWLQVYPENSMRSLQLLNALILPLLDLVIILLFFQEEHGKVCIAIIFSESMGIIVLQICHIVVKLLQHRNDINAHVVTFMWSDFLIFPVFALIFIPYYWLIRSFLLRFRNWKMKHAWIALVLYGIYYLSSLRSYFVDYSSGTEIIEGSIGIVSVWVFLMIGTVYIFIMQYRRQKELENEGLRKKQNMMETHYALLCEDSAMENVRTLNEQMNDLLKIDTEEGRTEQLTKYLQSMKESRAKAQAGIYCSYWLVDSALVSQARQMEPEHIQLDCSIHQCQIGSVDEAELAQLLYSIIEQVRKSNVQEKITLEMKSVVNQLVIIVKWKAPWKKLEFRQSFAWIKKYTKKYDGTYVVRKSREVREIEVCLDTGVYQKNA